MDSLAVPVKTGLLMLLTNSHVLHAAEEENVAAHAAEGGAEGAAAAGSSTALTVAPAAAAAPAAGSVAIIAAVLLRSGEGTGTTTSAVAAAAAAAAKDTTTPVPAGASDAGSSTGLDAVVVAPPAPAPVVAPASALGANGLHPVAMPFMGWLGPSRVRTALFVLTDPDLDLDMLRRIRGAAEAADASAAVEVHVLVASPRPDTVSRRVAETAPGVMLHFLSPLHATVGDIEDADDEDEDEEGEEEGEAEDGATRPRGSSNAHARLSRSAAAAAASGPSCGGSLCITDDMVADAVAEIAANALPEEDPVFDLLVVPAHRTADVDVSVVGAAAGAAGKPRSVSHVSADTSPAISRTVSASGEGVTLELPEAPATGLRARTKTLVARLGGAKSTSAGALTIPGPSGLHTGPSISGLGPLVDAMLRVTPACTHLLTFLPVPKEK